MRASLASGPGDATIRGVAPDASIVDKPLRPRSHRFTIRGSVEIDSARELEQRLRDVVLGGTSTVIFDLSGIEELDSSLIGVLIRTQRSSIGETAGCSSHANRRPSGISSRT
jgi:hypothetical protein